MFVSSKPQSGGSLLSSAINELEALQVTRQGQLRAQKHDQLAAEERLRTIKRSRESELKNLLQRQKENVALQLSFMAKVASCDNAEQNQEAALSKLLKRSRRVGLNDRAMAMRQIIETNQARCKARSCEIVAAAKVPSAPCSAPSAPSAPNLAEAEAKLRELTEAYRRGKPGTKALVAETAEITKKIKEHEKGQLGILQMLATNKRQAIDLRFQLSELAKQERKAKSSQEKSETLYEVELRG